MKSLYAAIQEFETQFGVIGESLPEFIEPEQPEPVCPQCQGIGYYHLNVDYRHPLFGKMFRCDNPDCPTVRQMLAEQVERVMNISTWASTYGEWTFDTFKASMRGKQWTGKRGAFAAALGFANLLGSFTLNEAAQLAWNQPWKGQVADRTANGVVLTGDVGLGKTGLAVAAVNELRARLQPVVFVRVQELIRRIQETYQDDWQGETANTRMNFYSGVPYLVIDEFGVKDFSTNRKEIMEAIIRERDRRGLPLMATTNLNRQEFVDSWGAQIGDIVSKAHWVSVDGIKLRNTTSETAAW